MGDFLLFRIIVQIIPQLADNTNMNLVFIYGPPASGKLTVATELAATTGYKLFHNHLTYDFIHGIFGDINTDDLNHRVRLEIFKQAVKSDVPGMIFTFVYGFGLDEDFIKSVINVVESPGGHVHFVQLVCDKNVLYQRVVQDSRKNFKKITNTSALDEMLGKYDILTTIPSEIHPSLVIDNTNKEAVEVSQIIKTTYLL